MQADPVYRYARAGFSLEVWPNRIEVVERRGMLFARDYPTTILLRNVASVQREGLAGHLAIALNDGTRHRYLIGVDAEQARLAILGVL